MKTCLWRMRDWAVLFLHFIATIARLAGPGGARSVVAESILVKQQARGPDPAVSLTLSTDWEPAMGP